MLACNWLIILVICHWSFVLQDPVKDGDSKIKADFNDLHERMQTAFRNLEEF